MRRNENKGLKRELLAALVAGNAEKVRQLKRKIMFQDAMPFFITYEIKGGLYCLDWKGLKLTPEQFDQLKQDCPQTVYWEEEKAYLPIAQDA